ncbi:neutral zinc metallopeptidase [Nonomuraea sp. NBC_01738]|uniref:hypothetical protein n=1 Tax=Nonomuraea sp. NBC_01738 TaxID=2976003 RepID=UPI002E0F69A7|nr:neutral zinc metallopeptidase [Nonomuraea sp. NBC_01738]
MRSLLSILAMTVVLATSLTAAPATASATAADVNGDIRVAMSVVPGYWTQHWRELSTRAVRHPQVYYFRQGGSLVCDRQRVTISAFYCPGQHYIGYNWDVLARGHAQAPPSVYLILAHEWGHAVQAMAGLRSGAPELQADCLAAVALYGAARDGRLRFNQANVNQMAQVLTQYADRTPWTSARSHGSAAQRISAFTRGANSVQRGYGVRGCL